MELPSEWKSMKSKSQCTLRRCEWLLGKVSSADAIFPLEVVVTVLHRYIQCLNNKLKNVHPWYDGNIEVSK